MDINWLFSKRMLLKYVHLNSKKKKEHKHSFFFVLCQMVLFPLFYSISLIKLQWCIDIIAAFFLVISIVRCSVCVNVILFFFFLFWTSIRLLLHQTYQYLHLYTMCSKTKLEKIVLSLTIVCFCNGLLFLYDFFLLSIFVACLTLCQTYESYSHSRIVFVLLFRSLTYVIRQKKENNTLWWVKEK
jgi:hypothetical protein